MCDEANDGHDHAEVPRVPGPHWESRLGSGPGSDGMVPFELRVRVYVKAPESYYDQFATDVNDNPLPTTYICQRALDADKQRFQRDFQAAIHQHWNNQLWLGPTRRTRRDIPPLKCGVSLEFVDQPADCNIYMLYRPTLAPGQPSTADNFRAFCDRRDPRDQIDIVIDYPPNNSFDVTFNGMPTSNHGAQTFHQNYAAHEFGHYLGLNHTCHTPATANTGADYCGGRSRGRQRNIMSVGNLVHPEHARAWWQALPAHHHHCGLAWGRHTMREPRPG